MLSLLLEMEFELLKFVGLLKQNEIQLFVPFLLLHQLPVFVRFTEAEACQVEYLGNLVVVLLHSLKLVLNHLSVPLKLELFLNKPSITFFCSFFKRSPDRLSSNLLLVKDTSSFITIDI